MRIHRSPIKYSHRWNGAAIAGLIAFGAVVVSALTGAVLL